MDVARLNMSHNDRDFHRRAYGDLRAAAAAVGRAFDFCGPKIRVGSIQGGAVELVRGAAVRLTHEPEVGTAECIAHT